LLARESSIDSDGISRNISSRTIKNRMNSSQLTGI
jgi:hypothetical protein